MTDTPQSPQDWATVGGESTHPGTPSSSASHLSEDYFEELEQAVQLLWEHREKYCQHLSDEDESLCVPDAKPEVTHVRTQTPITMSAVALKPQSLSITGMARFCFWLTGDAGGLPTPWQSSIAWCALGVAFIAGLSIAQQAQPGVQPGRSYFALPRSNNLGHW